MSMLMDAIRDGIKRAEAKGTTRYRIAKETGISQAALSRFMGGERGLGVEMVEKLADHLGLIITIKRKGKTTKGR